MFLQSANMCFLELANLNFLDLQPTQNFTSYKILCYYSNY